MTPSEATAKAMSKSRSQLPRSAQHDGLEWGTPATLRCQPQAPSEDPDVVFAGELADFVAQFEFEEGGEDLRAGERGVESFDQLVDVDGGVGLDGGEDLLLRGGEFGGGRRIEQGCGARRGKLGLTLLELEADFGGEFLEDILPGGGQLGSLLDEGVGGPGEFVGDVAGDGEDFPALLQGAAAGDAGAAELSGFDHQDAARQAADDAVAQGEIVRIGAGGERKFADQRAAQFEDLLAELAIFAGIDDIDAGAEDGDGASAGLHGSLVGDGVDAAGHAADDDQAAVGEVLREPLGHAEAVGRGVAGADDGDGGVEQNAGIAAHVEDERRIVDFGQVRGVELRAEGDERDAGDFGELFQLLVGQAERVLRERWTGRWRRAVRRLPVR